MDEFLDRIFLDNTIKSYLFVLGALLGLYLLQRFFTQPLSKILFTLVRVLNKEMEWKAFMKLVLGPLEDFFIVVTAVIVISALQFPALLNFRFYKTDVQTIFDRIAITLIIIFFFRVLFRMIDYLAFIINKRVEDNGEQNQQPIIIFFKDFFKALVCVAAVLTVIKFAFGYQITELLTGLGILGVAIALSARESFENFIASFIIFFDKPFSIGDTLKVNQVTGTVEKIGLRSTKLRTIEKTYASVPNKQMVDSIVDNLTFRTQRRADIKLELSNSTSTEELEACMAGLKEILANPLIENYNLHFADIALGSFIIQSDYYSAPITIDAFNNLKNEVNLSIVSLLNQLNITLTKPARAL